MRIHFLAITSLFLLCSAVHAESGFSLAPTTPWNQAIQSAVAMAPNFDYDAEFADQYTAQNTQPAKPKSKNPFAAGSWTAQFYASQIILDPDHGFMTAAHAGFGYFFTDGLSINFEPLFGYVDTNFCPYGGHGIAGGFDLLFRWHFWGIDENDKLSVYFVGGAGFQLADTNFPSDSHHDFRLTAGFGTQFKVPNTENMRIMFEAKYIHISNAGTSDVNDGLDGAQLAVGVMFNY